MGLGLYMGCEDNNYDNEIRHYLIIKYIDLLGISNKFPKLPKNSFKA